MTSPDHASPGDPQRPPIPHLLPAFRRFVRPNGLMQCCRDMLATSRRMTRTGSEAECPTCHAVMLVDAAGAWTWQPAATAEALRKLSQHG